MLISAPKVSILLPTYNRAAYLRLALESILAQTFTNFEVVVMDNASTDDTPAVVASFDDPRIVYHRNPRNVGAVGNHNRGLRHCRGEYLAIFSDDDLMLPDNLARKVAVLEAHPTVGLVYSDALVIDAEGQPGELHYTQTYCYQWNAAKHQNPMPASVAHHLLMHYELFVIFPTVLVRASFFEEHNLEFNNQLHYLIDWDLCLKVSALHDFYFLDEKLVHYRYHGNNEGKQLEYLSYFKELCLAKLAVYTFFRNREFDTTDLVTIYKQTLGQFAWARQGDNPNTRPLKDYLKTTSRFRELAKQLKW